MSDAPVEVSNNDDTLAALREFMRELVREMESDPHFSRSPRLPAIRADMTFGLNGSAIRGIRRMSPTVRSRLDSMMVLLGYEIWHSEAEYDYPDR